jgi:putative transposase
MFKAYKYRIYPNIEQRELIEKTFDACRFVYNLALETKQTCYKSNGTNLSAIDLCYQLADLKEDIHWLREVDSQALQASVKKIDAAFKGFFKGGGFPKFKKKANRQSFQCPNHKRHVDFDKQTLTIPKIKDIPIALSRHFLGAIKTVTISKTSTGKYFA